MILSVSRRTDIPAFYEVVLNRLKAGFVYVKKSYESPLVSRIDLAPEVNGLYCLFGQNPEPMLKYLDEFSGYPFYFPIYADGLWYGYRAWLGRPKGTLLSVFASLAQKNREERVIWRYDPIILRQNMQEAYHLYEFEKIAKALYGYTDKCVISFVDM